VYFEDSDILGCSTLWLDTSGRYHRDTASHSGGLGIFSITVAKTANVILRVHGGEGTYTVYRTPAQQAGMLP
jgi:hypothetical protein